MLVLISQPVLHSFSLSLSLSLSWHAAGNTEPVVLDDGKAAYAAHQLQLLARQLTFIFTFLVLRAVKREALRDVNSSVSRSGRGKTCPRLGIDTAAWRCLAAERMDMTFRENNLL